MNRIKVMIADHKILDVIKLSQYIRDYGYEVTYLTSPHGVLAKIDYDRPDVIFINPEMPRLFWDFVIQSIQSNPNFEGTAIVALGDGEGEDLRQLSIQYNLNGFFLKSNGLESIGEFLDELFQI